MGHEMVLYAYRDHAEFDEISSLHFFQAFVPFLLIAVHRRSSRLCGTSPGRISWRYAKTQILQRNGIRKMKWQKQLKS